VVVVSEAELLGVAGELGAARVAGMAPAERRLLARAVAPSPATLRVVRQAIEVGEDPLGEAFSRLRPAVERRSQGATYTPAPIVRAMLAWAVTQGTPARVIDPGAGSGRFLVEAGRRFPRARLVGVEIDPLAALLARANLAATGLGDRAEVILWDFREVALPTIAGPSLYVGNPPYVRHHAIAPAWKRWLRETAARRGLRASQLAGLHVHFFLATLERARPGDFGAYITAAEWLDVNYGDVVRRLFLDGLGGVALHLIEPTARPFPDADATGAIACFRVGERPATVRVRRVAALSGLGDLGGGRAIARTALAEAARWTPLSRGRPRPRTGLVELGELCRVRRGQVTGANAFWIAGAHAAGLPPEVLFPTVTRAKELFGAGSRLGDAAALRRVIDLPEDLGALAPEARRRVEAFLREGRSAGVHQGYIAAHRTPWWSVGLHEPAPILATYMARRPPAFVRNAAGVRHINIAHGLYPVEPMTEAQLDALVRYLAGSVDLADGRTYSGGLTKFEPREMERLLVPLA